jgi:hypothetical protein
MFGITQCDYCAPKDHIGMLYLELHTRLTTVTGMSDTRNEIDSEAKLQQHTVNYMVLRRLSFRPPLAHFPCGHEVFNVPEPVCHASSHCRRHAERAVNLDEVVREVAECDSSDVILDLL